jgi:hypothetical protein
MAVEEMNFIFDGTVSAPVKKKLYTCQYSYGVQPYVKHPRTLQNHSHDPDKSYAQHLSDIALCTY